MRGLLPLPRDAKNSTGSAICHNRPQAYVVRSGDNATPISNFHQQSLYPVHRSAWGAESCRIFSYRPRRRQFTSAASIRTFLKPIAFYVDLMMHDHHETAGNGSGHVPTPQPWQWPDTLDASTGRPSVIGSSLKMSVSVLEVRIGTWGNRLVARAELAECVVFARLERARSAGARSLLSLLSFTDSPDGQFLSCSDKPGHIKKLGRLGRLDRLGRRLSDK